MSRTRYIFMSSPYCSPVTPLSQRVHLHVIMAVNSGIDHPTSSKTDAHRYISMHAMRGIRGYLMDILNNTGYVSWFSSL